MVRTHNVIMETYKNICFKKCIIVLEICIKKNMHVYILFVEKNVARIEVVRQIILRTSFYFERNILSRGNTDAA